MSEGGASVDRPRVASLPDGRYAVAWSAGSDVFVQRYDAKGSKKGNVEMTWKVEEGTK